MTKKIKRRGKLKYSYKYTPDYVHKHSRIYIIHTYTQKNPFIILDWTFRSLSYIQPNRVWFLPYLFSTFNLKYHPTTNLCINTLWTHTHLSKQVDFTFSRVDKLQIREHGVYSFVYVLIYYQYIYIIYRPFLRHENVLIWTHMYFMYMYLYVLKRKKSCTMLYFVLSV